MVHCFLCFFFFKQKTAYEMRISDWSSDVCSSDLLSVMDALHAVDFAEVVVLLLDATKGLEAQDLRIADKVLQEGRALIVALNKWDVAEDPSALFNGVRNALDDGLSQVKGVPVLSISGATGKGIDTLRSEEHTSELQSLMRNSYAVFCLNKKKNTIIILHYLYIFSNKSTCFIYLSPLTFSIYTLYLCTLLYIHFLLHLILHSLFNFLYIYFYLISYFFTH